MHRELCLVRDLLSGQRSLSQPRISHTEKGRKANHLTKNLWAFYILLVLLWNTFRSGSPRGEINNYLWGKKFTWFEVLYSESNSLLAVSGIRGDEHQLQPGFWVRAESRGNHSCSRAPVLVISFRMMMAGLFFYHSPPLLGGGFLYHQIPSKSSNSVIQ